jgi:hypothetical protein
MIQILSNLSDRGDLCFDSKTGTLSCIDHSVLSLSIGYDDTVTTKTEQLGNLVLRCLGYVQFSQQETDKVHWALVSPVMKAEAKVLYAGTRGVL